MSSVNAIDYFVSYINKTFARIAKAALHKLPGKSSLKVSFVCPICPVSPLCPFCPVHDHNDYPDHDQ